MNRKLFEQKGFVMAGGRGEKSDDLARRAVGKILGSEQGQNITTEGGKQLGSLITNKELTRSDIVSMNDGTVVRRKASPYSLREERVQSGEGRT
jgi:hypothetical protein